MPTVEYELKYGDMISKCDHEKYEKTEQMMFSDELDDDGVLKKFYDLCWNYYHVYDYMDLIKKTIDINRNVVSETVLGRLKKNSKMTYELDIDTMSESDLYKYFTNIYFKMGLYPNTPYEHKLTTNVDWLEFIDTIKKCVKYGVIITQQRSQFELFYLDRETEIADVPMPKLK
tara:strand:- start:21 stop:539 length:519 start_codon:yes stop_codon:yes gene_type:complete